MRRCADEICAKLDSVANWQHEIFVMRHVEGSFDRRRSAPVPNGRATRFGRVFTASRTCSFRPLEGQGRMQRAFGTLA